MYFISELSVCFVWFFGIPSKCRIDLLLYYSALIFLSLFLSASTLSLVFSDLIISKCACAGGAFSFCSFSFFLKHNF